VVIGFGTIMLWTGLAAALAGQFVFARRTTGRPTVMPVLLLGVVLAALAATGEATAGDAIALALVVGAWTNAAGVGLSPAGTARGTVADGTADSEVGRYAGAGIGLALGAGLLVSPLVAGGGVGLWRAWRGDAQGRARCGLWVVVGGLLAVTVRAAVAAVDAEAGRMLAGGLAIPETLARLGPAGVWRYGSELLDLVAPVLVVGALGAAVLNETDGTDPASASDARSQPELPLLRGARAWLLLNVALACAWSRLACGHAVVMIAPAVLLVGPGWSALRRLTATSARRGASLIGGVGLFLLAVLCWVPLRQTCAALLTGLLPP